MSTPIIATDLDKKTAKLFRNPEPRFYDWYVLVQGPEDGYRISYEEWERIYSEHLKPKALGPVEINCVESPTDRLLITRQEKGGLVYVEAENGAVLGKEGTETAIAKLQELYRHLWGDGEEGK